MLLYNIYTLLYIYIYNYTYTYSYGEGDGTPLQYSCLENPMDGGAWWAAVYGVAQSRTRLSDLAAAYIHIHTYKHVHIHTQLSHSAVYLKLTQHCKSTLFQQK